jgi:hypothetical protein
MVYITAEIIRKKVEEAFVAFQIKASTLKIAIQ